MKWVLRAAGLVFILSGVGMMTIVAFDRRWPVYDIVARSFNVAAEPGDTISIEYRYRIAKKCPSVLSRTLVDGDGATYVLSDLPFETTPESPVPPDGTATPYTGIIVVRAVVPESAKAGTMRLVAIWKMRCDFFQLVWPVEVYLPESWFIVLGSPRKSLGGSLVVPLARKITDND